MQNITLLLPKDLLRKVKHIAIDRQTSVSGLLINIEEIVIKKDLYEKAKWRNVSLLERDNINLGTEGKITWNRDDLYAF
ncbi:CopG family transcriptional regulator [Caldicoprobacter algeriensis]|uniref:CopG family transcriptional regulator n=1 Tax=Caldicoprobacter algeriensis TaxID=699281 RepID=UPI0020794B18|nr:CopG family transcriptional regulator [Caldicoprobacter algeriensis]MCM8899809.1 CopG family transcriptional regulator [Caldicoprobacter algeriensis]